MIVTFFLIIPLLAIAQLLEARWPDSDSIPNKVEVPTL